MMITVSTSEGTFGEAFFFRPTSVFWLPFKDSSPDYKIYNSTEDLNNEKWLWLGAGVLTKWSEEE